MPRAGSTPPKPVRKAGKTMSMVRDLPAPGSVVFVPDYGMRDYVESMIMGLRGNDVLRNTRVLMVNNIKVARAIRLAGSPLFTDHRYFERADAELATYVRLLGEPALANGE